MRERLAVGLLQADLVWQSPADNYLQLADLLAEQALGLHLVLLPETFTTGFTQSTQEFAEAFPGPTLRWMQAQAALHNFTLAGSYHVREDGRYYNRFVWVHPDGDYGYYDKRHLFSMAGEHEVFTPGHARKIFECQGWRCLPQICYDLRFPVFSRSRGDYDLAIYVANWPEARTAQWQRLLPARAIENQAFVAGVNRVGIDGEGYVYPGDSQIYDPLGEPMCENEGGVTLLRAELSALQLARLRDRFPVHDDADEFTLRL
ncbi:amidohydrolase [Simiduia agarivorans]|uniref:Omega-amidase YafV n=1 Tax=Simiduia agarivorans (strain DSM 21679 / JCM 13881 / BCRC 17597 / SA1) TaxID=1117647 RepID=K4KF28_SIMAS|nr:amidohydrolase [Simiduia agarivorans]AFU97561.1 nitrilase/cyanide hydratase and apolipoprotein N-acyltransferase [Simiduia agarivorans SA1 = DSM 21679]